MDPRSRYLNLVSTFPSLQADNCQDVLGDVGPAADSRLTEEQQTYAQKLIDMVGQFGQFGQSGPDGCQYVDKSPQPDACCLQCIFYAGAGDCNIVDGQIDPMGICRFNLCPASDPQPVSLSPTAPALPEPTS